MPGAGCAPALRMASAATTASTQTLLWSGPWPPSDSVRAAVEGRWELCPCEASAFADGLERHRLAMVHYRGEPPPAQLRSLLKALDGSDAVCVFVLPRQSRAWGVLSRWSGQVICLGDTADGAEIAGALSAAAALQPTFADLRAQLLELRGRCTHEEELDEEMRLAARLQRDFLPRRLPEVGTARFGVLYRPASWLSGDIYDAVRLDETTVGFYVADVVGHGMPAALLTMFIKRALQTKRIVGNTYQIVPPHVSLEALNADMCRQNLSSCQFCTALYGVLDTNRLCVTFCRGGHPEPLLVHPDGRCERLSSPGPLLGIFEDEPFVSNTTRLATGDRIILYTDGAEEALRPDPQVELPLEQAIAPHLLLPRDELLLKLTSIIDQGGKRPSDDATVMVVDV
jgi:hypothetical protein